MKRVLIALFAFFVLSGVGWAQENYLSEIQAPAFISGEAKADLLAEKHKAAVKEAKELLLKRERLEQEIQDIDRRLRDLDDGAPAKEFGDSSSISYSGASSTSNVLLWKDSDMTWSNLRPGVNPGSR